MLEWRLISPEDVDPKWLRRALYFRMGDRKRKPVKKGERHSDVDPDRVIAKAKARKAAEIKALKNGRND